GYASAGNIISGRLLGAKDYRNLVVLSKKVSLYGLGVAVLLMGVATLLYEPLGLVFTNDPEVLSEFKKVFFIIILLQPINAKAFIFDGMFKGMAQMKYLRNVLFAATFIGFLPALFLGDYLGWQLYGIWIAFSVWILIRSSALVIKFRKTIVPKAQAH